MGDGGQVKGFDGKGILKGMIVCGYDSLVGLWISSSGNEFLKRGSKRSSSLGILHQAFRRYAYRSSVATHTSFQPFAEIFVSFSWALIWYGRITIAISTFFFF